MARMDLQHRHQCLVYEGAPQQQLPALAAIIQRKLNDNFRCLYINSVSMVEGMRTYLARIGVNVPERIARGSLMLSSEIIVSKDGDFDIGHMVRKIENALDQALAESYKGLFATGDMTWEFGAKRDFSRLLKYEWALEKLFHKRPELHGVCQYHNDTLTREVMRQGVLSHRAIFINETLSRINHHYAESEEHAARAAADVAMDKTVERLTREQLR